MTIDELYDLIYTDETTKDSNRFLNIYEHNKNLVDNQIIDGDKEVHNKVMRLTADYAHHLTMKENYKKALPIIDKAIGLFQTYSDFKDTDLFKISFYETLVFDRVVVNYYLKNIKGAKNDLKTLTDKFPDNDKYKNWLNATKTYSTQTFINILWYIIVAVVLTTAIVERIDIGVFYDIILYIGAVALITVVLAEIMKVIRKRKIKNGGTATRKQGFRDSMKVKC